jgi:hypothetical protein
LCIETVGGVVKPLLRRRIEECQTEASGCTDRRHRYALRWKIEVLHKILKSGCKVESSGLCTAERLIRLIATCYILAWRIFWMTMIRRSEPTATPTIALTSEEIQVLERLRPANSMAQSKPRLLSDYIIQIAGLDGYLARARDPAPGNIIMWRGLSRLADLTRGFSLHAKTCGLSKVSLGRLR